MTRSFFLFHAPSWLCEGDTLLFRENIEDFAERSEKGNLLAVDFNDWSAGKPAEKELVKNGECRTSTGWLQVVVNADGVVKPIAYSNWKGYAPDCGTYQLVEKGDFVFSIRWGHGEDGSAVTVKKAVMVDVDDNDHWEAHKELQRVEVFLPFELEEELSAWLTPSGRGATSIADIEGKKLVKFL